MFKKEYIFAVLIGLVALILSNAYVFSGLLMPKEGMSFLYRHYVNSQDTYTYVAFIEQSRQGEILYQNLYTSDPQTASLIRPSYVLIGLFANALNISSIAAYHLGRLLFSIPFLVILYIFIGKYFHTSKRRLFTFAIVLSSSGLGYLLSGFWPNSSDTWIPESLTYLMLQDAPHFIFSQFLMLVSFLFFMKGIETKKIFNFFIVSFSLFLLGFEHPYSLFICMVTAFLFGAYFLWKKSISRKTIFWAVGSVFVGGILGCLYQLFELQRNPIFKSWAFPSDSPIPRDYVIGYGLILFFALVGIEVFLKEKKKYQILALSWFAATCMLVYAPVYFQRRMSEGFHIPLSILASEGVIIISIFLSSFMISKAKAIAKYMVACMLAGVLAIGAIMTTAQDVSLVQKDSPENYFYYLLDQEVRAMDYLKSHSTKQDVILSNWFYGNIIPGVTGRKVYLGHKAQTNNFDQKVETVNKFLLNENTQEAYKFLKDNNIKYVFIGKNDTLIKYGFQPQKKPYLQKIFDDSEAKVYRVK